MPGRDAAGLAEVGEPGDADVEGVGVGLGTVLDDGDGVGVGVGVGVGAGVVLCDGGGCEAGWLCCPCAGPTTAGDWK
ncbi:MAG TPA: hypothetical protein VF162_17840 [Streptosporangiaceae bacterium]